MNKLIYNQGKPSLFIYRENILPNDTYKELINFLKKQEYKGGICISGIPIPRLQRWYHMEGKFFCNSWKYRYDRWKAETYDSILLKVQKIIEVKTREIIEEYYGDTEIPPEIQIPIFNSCLVNKYRNGSDSIKPHQDSSISFGYYPTISNLSTVSTREIVINALNNCKNIKDKEFSFSLAPNSLFIMAGASQRYFTHSIPKQETEEERYSLTFREHIIKDEDE